MDAAMRANNGNIDGCHPTRKFLGLGTRILCLMAVLNMLVPVNAMKLRAGRELVAEHNAGVIPREPISDETTTIDEVVTVTINACSAPPPATSTTSPTSSPTSSLTSSLSPPSATSVIKSPCDNNPSADNSILQLYNSTGLPITGYRYTVHCNTWFKAEESPSVIKKVTVPDLNSCLQECYEYNQYFDPQTEEICYSVGIIKAPGEFCYLRGPPDPFSNVTVEYPHDSAIWIAD